MLPGMTCLSGLAGGILLDPSALAYINAMSVKPDDNRAVVINNLVVGLKKAGFWNPLNQLYLLAAHSIDAAQLNLFNPASAGTFHPSNFTKNRGLAYAGVAYNTVPKVNYTANQSTLGLYLNNGYTSGYSLVAPSSADGNNPNAYSGDDYLYIYVSRAGGGGTGTSGFKAHYALSALSATTWKFYKSGISLGGTTNADGDASISTSPLYIASDNQQGMSFFYTLVTSTSDADMVILDKLLNDYLAAVGGL
jgi:hypothetical protein